MGTSKSCHTTRDNWIFGSGWPKSIKVNTRAHRSSRLVSHQNEDPPFHNNGGKKLPTFQWNQNILPITRERPGTVCLLSRAMSKSNPCVSCHKEKRNWKHFWAGNCLQRSNESFSTHHCTMLHVHCTMYCLFWVVLPSPIWNKSVSLRQFFPASFPAWRVSRWHLQ